MKNLLFALALLLPLAWPSAMHAQDTDAATALKKEIITELAVNEADADSLSKLLLQYRVDKADIQQEFRTDPKLRGEKMKSLNDGMNAKVRGMLNEQQFKKFMMLLLKQ
jgi:hypothetical protein